MRIHPKPLFGLNPHNCPDISYYMADQIQNKNDRMALQAEISETIACAHLDASATSTAQQMVLATASQVLSISEQGTRFALALLKDVVRRMSAMPGQRLVVIVSAGFLTLNSESMETKIEVLDRAARENVVISSLDARGLYTDATYDASKQGSYTPQASILKSQYDRQSASAQADVLAELADGKLDTGFVTLATYIKPGNPMIPVGLRLPLEKLDPGAYRAEFQAKDTAGNVSILRSADFEVR